MNMYPPNLIITYLLVRALGATAILVIVLLIACPLIWSRNSRRRAHALEAFRMLIWLLADHQAR